MNSGRVSSDAIVANRRRLRRTPPSTTLEKSSSSSTKATETTTANLLAQVRQAVGTSDFTTDNTKSTPRYLPPASASSNAYDYASRRSAPNISPPNDIDQNPQGHGSKTNDGTTAIPATTNDPEEPDSKLVITLLVSSKKRPIPVPPVDTNPPKVIPNRPMPLLAAIPAYQKCLDGSATRLVQRMGMPNEEWKIIPCDHVEADQEMMVLYFGTPVRLQNHRGEYLNITAVDRTATTTTPNVESCNDDTQRALLISGSTTWDIKDPSTIWTLHPGTDPIPVGPTSSVPILDRSVRMAEAFSLRNTEWNGILQSSTLQLLTDAHEQPNIVKTEEFDEDHPMGRLWQAHSFIPSIQEIWYAQEPPDPKYHNEYDNDEMLDRTLFGSVHVHSEQQQQSLPIDTSVQETILLDELLGACMGLSGDYIQFDGEKYRLQNTEPFDTILHTTVTDLLEIPNAYRKVNESLRWQRHHDCPVRRALYEELQDWLDEYLEIILSQYRAFREGNLSIHTLQALHGARSTLNIMVTICQLTSCGGALIRSLPKIPRLLSAVMVPYHEQLKAWLTQGHLVDPDHFMIQKNSNATTWQEKYIVQQDHVLPDLMPTIRVVQQTLATGRYWNAVRICQTIHGVQISDDSSISLTSFVERQHGAASEALKAMLLPDLRRALQLIEDYFLMFKADTFLDFLEKSSVELGKDIELISRHRIQHFFNEPNIQCFFQNSSGKNMKGLDAFAIRPTNISFPSTIMLTRTVMLEYTSLFRLLFKVKFAEQKLLSVWKDHQLTKDLSMLALLTSTFALRHRMLHFINNLGYYLRYEVVEVQWGKFLMDINKHSNTVDDMLEIQRRFLDNVLEACMLKDRKARLALTVLIDVCILFTTQMEYFHEAAKLKVHDPTRRRVIAINSTSPSTAESCRERLEAAQERREHRRDIQSSRLAQAATSTSYGSMINQFSKAFDRRFNDFVGNLSTQHVPLSTRLNFNGFLNDHVNE